MQSSYDEQFERDMGCTEAEWLGWLPAALGECAWERVGASVTVAIAPGTSPGMPPDTPPGMLSLRWEPLPPRVIALMRMPRLKVSFCFTGLDSAQRYAFMKRFDLYMQRGGG